MSLPASCGISRSGLLTHDFNSYEMQSLYLCSLLCLAENLGSDSPIFSLGHSCAAVKNGINFLVLLISGFVTVSCVTPLALQSLV